MSGRGCYFDANGCYVCPELPAIIASPATVTTDAQLGWNAGADTIATLSGDVHVVDSFATAPMGVVFGLKASRRLPTEIALIAHGLYVRSVAGNCFVSVYELGQMIGTTQSYTLGNPLEILREGSKVTYWNNGVLMLTSVAKVLGPVFVNACLYAAGDTLP
jgi:hypothetical protein